MDNGSSMLSHCTCVRSVPWQGAQPIAQDTADQIHTHKARGLLAEGLAPETPSKEAALD